MALGLVIFASIFLFHFQSVFCQTFRPAAVPLAVRSPYFSAWQNTTIGTNVADEWPQFWNDNENNPNPILGWAGIIQVDNVAYKWLGADTVSKTANLSGIQVTPTRTIYTVQAGPMDVIVTFLTPIEIGSDNLFPSPMSQSTLAPTTGSRIIYSSILISVQQPKCLGQVEHKLDKLVALSSN
ncbi:predicted protein [Postia placenta Mad-698-R]|nr:predicted protein [Postia placenta Mad-698-R]